MFNDEKTDEAINLIMVNREFNDCAVSGRFQGMGSQGAYSLSFMQSLSRWF